MAVHMRLMVWRWKTGVFWRRVRHVLLLLLMVVLMLEFGRRSRGKLRVVAWVTVLLLPLLRGILVLLLPMRLNFFFPLHCLLLLLLRGRSGGSVPNLLQ